MRIAFTLFILTTAACTSLSPFEVQSAIVATGIAPVQNMLADDANLYWVSYDPGATDDAGRPVGHVLRMRKDGGEKPVQMIRESVPHSGHIAMDDHNVYFTQVAEKHGSNIGLDGQIDGIRKTAKDVTFYGPGVDPGRTVTCSPHVPDDVSSAICGIAVDDQDVFWLARTGAGTTTTSIFAAAKDGSQCGDGAPAFGHLLDTSPTTSTNCVLATSAGHVAWFDDEPGQGVFWWISTPLSGGSDKMQTPVPLGDPPSFSGDMPMVIGPHDSVYFAAPTTTPTIIDSINASASPIGLSSALTTDGPVTALAVDGTEMYWIVELGPGDGRLMRGPLVVNESPAGGGTSYYAVNSAPSELLRGNIRGLAVDGDYVYAGVDDKIVRLSK